jgi:autotransporter-associated beta strand protein
MSPKKNHPLSNPPKQINQTDMKPRARILCCFLPALLVVGPAQAAEYTWRSDQNNDNWNWNNTGNWNDGNVFQDNVDGNLRFSNGNDDWVNGDVNITNNVPSTLTTRHLTLQGRADDENTKVTIGSSGNTLILNDNNNSGGTSEISLNGYNNGNRQLTFDVRMNITLKNNVTLRNNGDSYSAINIFSGNIGEDGGSRQIIKNDASQVWLTGTNSYTGGTRLRGGTVWINTDRSLGADPGSFASENVRFENGTLMKMSGGDVVFSANRGVRFENAGTVGGDGGMIWNGVVSGSGDFNKVGGLTMSLGANNSYSGNISVNQGTLEVQGDGKLQNGNYNGSVSITGDGTFRYSGNGGQTQIMNGAISGDRELRKEGGGSTLTLANNNSGFNGFVNIQDGTLQLGNGGTSGALNPGVAINLNSGGATLAFNRSDTLTQGTHFQSALSGSGQVAQKGSGTTILTGTNTYAGMTAVEAGKLLVNGSNTGTGTVNVASGATLGGTGSVAGAVNVSGMLAPGASIESLATGAVSFLTGSTFAYELDSAALNGDLVYSTGALDIAAGTTLTLTELASGTLGIGSKFTLISYFGGWTSAELFTYDAATLADDSIFTLGANQWQFKYNDTTGGTNFSADQSGATSFVTMSVVPEPATALLSGIGILALLRRRRS